MKRSIIAILITIIIAVPAFMLGPVFWPRLTDHVPTSSQLPFFIFLSVIEALLFGFGFAFIYIAYPHLKKVSPEKKTKTYLAFLALLWFLVSWWPHDNLHQHVGLEFAGLLKIEYGFHLTLIIASLILVLLFYF